MRNRSCEPGWRLLALLATLATAGGCQSSRYDSGGLGIAG